MIDYRVFEKAAWLVKKELWTCCAIDGAVLLLRNKLDESSPEAKLWEEMHKPKGAYANRILWFGKSKYPKNQILRETLLREAALCIKEQFNE